MMVQATTTSSAAEIPFVDANSLALVRGGYGSPNIAAYAARVAERSANALHVPIINKHAERDIQVALSLPARHQGVFQTRRIAALRAEDLIDRTLVVSETPDDPFSATHLTVEAHHASILQIALR